MEPFTCLGKLSYVSLAVSCRRWEARCELSEHTISQDRGLIIRTHQDTPWWQDATARQQVHFNVTNLRACFI